MLQLKKDVYSSLLKGKWDVFSRKNVKSWKLETLWVDEPFEKRLKDQESARVLTDIAEPEFLSVEKGPRDESPQRWLLFALGAILQTIAIWQVQWAFSNYQRIAKASLKVIEHVPRIVRTRAWKLGWRDTGKRRQTVLQDPELHRTWTNSKKSPCCASIRCGYSSGQGCHMTWSSSYDKVTNRIDNIGSTRRGGDPYYFASW